MNVYITGTSGFLGKELIKYSNKNEKVKNLYCPIRNKKDLTGQQRFNNLFSSFEKCRFCNCESIPKDTNVIVLNAYSVSFSNELKNFFDENVTPIINLLKKCKKLDNLKKIIFISTAYTQPHSPYNINNDLCNEVIKTNNVMKHYNKIIKSKISWDEIQNNVTNSHFSHNTYIYSKIITEHICKYFAEKLKCPLSIIRPSQISLSSDGKYASKFGSMSYIYTLETSFIRTILNKGKKQDQIPVDKVSSIIISEYTNMSNNIIFATSGCDLSPKKTKNIIMPSKLILFFDEKNFLFYFIRYLEIHTYKILNKYKLLSDKKYKLICSFYKNYDYFCYNTWYFPSNYPFSNIDDYLIKMKDYLQNNSIK